MGQALISRASSLQCTLARARPSCCFGSVQAWQAAHPSFCGRGGGGGGGSFRRRPAVHNGFLKSYIANGFNERIVSKVVDVVRSHDWPTTQVLSMCLP